MIKSIKQLIISLIEFILNRQCDIVDVYVNLIEPTDIYHILLYG